MSEPTRPHILVVDDEQLLHGVMERLLTRHGMRVTSCHSAPQAMEVLRKDAVDLVITDFQMPGMNGFELLAHVREEYEHIDVIIITGHANVQHAVQAMAHGAVDYLPKPFSTSALVERVQAHLARSASPADDAAPSTDDASKPAAPTRSAKKSAKSKKQTTFIGEHPRVQELRKLIPRLARSLAPVFIHGESGTGKEIVSRIVHDSSDRAGGPFVAINCANLPKELVESHLFGHRKGAFTGAIDDVVGAFEQAEGGTLLLDEVTEIDLDVQAKLLRVLQEKEYHRVGDPKPRKADVRIVATSNRDLKGSVDDGSFREDLYHRLAVFPLTLPPLRARLSDVPPLADHFIQKYCALYGLPEKVVAADLMAQFQRYEWPGNVRQLENLLHRGVVMAADAPTIAAEDVLNEFFGASHTPSDAAGGGLTLTHDDGTRVTIEEMERRMILQALADNDNNQREAAEQLGICARTIRNKLKKYREQGEELDFVS